MIDEKKIEEIKEEIYEDKFLFNGEEIYFDNDDKEEMFYKDDIKESIALGAKWAINEIKKNLWHDGEEVPTEKNKHILMYYEAYSCGESELDFNGYYELCKTGKDGFDENTWKILCDVAGWCSKWLYIDDLLKGGE